MLSAELAGAADEMLERTMTAAGLEASTTGASLDAALAHHFTVMRRRWPGVHALVLERLRETDSERLLALAQEVRTDD